MKVLALITWLAIALALTSIALMIAYTVSNNSGHTGLEPYFALFIFVPVALLGIAGLLSKRLSTSMTTSVCALLIGSAGSGLIVYLDQTNQLVNYERWIKRGMPEP